MARPRETSPPHASNEKTSVALDSAAQDSGLKAGEIGEPGRPTIDPPDIWVDLGLGAGLILLVALLFGRAVGFDFVNLDDPTYITDNEHVGGGPTPENLLWGLTTLHHSNWHPLTWWSWQFDIAVWGQEPWGHHLTNVVLHAVNVLLVWRVVWILTGLRLGAFAIALIFAIHPLRWESVAWISERKGLLSALFALLAVERYDAYVRAPGWRRMGAVTLCLTLSLMSKGMAVSLPCVLLLLDWRPYRRWTSWQGTWRLVFEKWPMWVIVAVTCVLTVAAQKGGGAVRNLEEVTLTQRIVGAGWAYAVYVGQTLWPLDLCVFYPIQKSRPLWQPIVALATVGLLTLVAFLARRRWPAASVAWLCYLGMLIPVIGLVQVGEQAHADRYTYLPSIPLLVMLGTMLVATAGRSWSQRLQTGLLVAVAVPLFVVSFNQGGTWRNRRTMWQQATRVAPCGISYWHLGQLEMLDRRYAEAVAAFRESTRINPDSAEDRSALAAALDGLGHTDEAERVAREALELAKPDSVGVIARCRFILGKAAARRGEIEDAARDLDTSLANATDLVLRNDAAVQLLRLGPEGARLAIPHLRKLASEYPASPEFPGNIGNAFIEMSDWPSAAAEFAKAASLDPGRPQLRSRWITALLASGESDTARAELRILLAQDPNWPTTALQAADRMTLDPKSKHARIEEGYWLAGAIGVAFENPPAEALKVMAQGAAGLGRFDEAERLAETAIATAVRNGRPDLASAIQKQQQRYHAKERPTPLEVPQ